MSVIICQAANIETLRLLYIWCYGGGDFIYMKFSSQTSGILKKSNFYNIIIFLYLKMLTLYCKVHKFGTMILKIQIFQFVKGISIINYSLFVNIAFSLISAFFSEHIDILLVDYHYSTSLPYKWI